MLEQLWPIQAATCIHWQRLLSQAEVIKSTDSSEFTLITTSRRTDNYNVHLKVKVSSQVLRVINPVCDWGLFCPPFGWITFVAFMCTNQTHNWNWKNKIVTVLMWLRLLGLVFPDRRLSWYVLALSLLSVNLSLATFPGLPVFVCVCAFGLLPLNT